MPPSHASSDSPLRRSRFASVICLRRPLTSHLAERLPAHARVRAARAYAIMEFARRVAMTRGGIAEHLFLRRHPPSARCISTHDLPLWVAVISVADESPALMMAGGKKTDGL
jgi:hypothetical protein